MSPKHKAFCEFYVQCHNAAESARRAGYSAKTAKSSGQRLLTYVDVKNYIAELEKNSTSTAIASAEEILLFFTTTMRNAAVGTKDRLKAAQLLAEHYALFDDQADTSANTDRTVQIIFADTGDGSGGAPA